jgi:transposase-like protein
MPRKIDTNRQSIVRALYENGLTISQIHQDTGYPLASIHRDVRDLENHRPRGGSDSLRDDRERLLKAKADRAEHDAELSRLEVAEIAGELVPAESVVEILSSLGDKFASFLTGLRSTLSEADMNEVLKQARAFANDFEREGDSILAKTKPSQANQ